MAAAATSVDSNICLFFGWMGPTVVEDVTVKEVKLVLPIPGTTISVKIPKGLNAENVKEMKFTVSRDGLVGEALKLSLSAALAHKLGVTVVLSGKDEQVVPVAFSKNVIPRGSYRLVVSFTPDSTLGAEVVKRKLILSDEDVRGRLRGLIGGHLIFKLGKLVGQLSVRMTSLEVGKDTPLKMGLNPMALTDEALEEAIKQLDIKTIRAMLDSIQHLLDLPRLPQRDCLVVSNAIKILTREFYTFFCKRALMNMFISPPADLCRLIEVMANEYADGFKK